MSVLRQNRTVSVYADSTMQSLPRGPVTPASPTRSDQSHPITTTKLEPPALPNGFIGHAQLLERITTSRSSLVLISAPAGWGKSSVLAAWSGAVEDDRAFAFVLLDDEDDEPRAFWSYIVAAIFGTESELPVDIAEVLAAPGGDSLHAIAPLLINHLKQTERSVVLALDDYHLITDPVVHRSVEYLIEHAPQGFQVAMATRSDPPFALARWRASGRLNETRLADLPMSPDDAIELLATRFDLTIDRRDAELLCARTEGWPAGIQLAGVSMSRDPDPRAFIETFAGNDRNIADYLTNEVLERQPAERSLFLLETSILDKMTADLCDYVLETTGSAATIEAIERENLFLLPLDSTRRWFRYHHQFKEWLSHTLRIVADQERIVDLHARAAAWHLEHGSEDRSIRHHLAAGGVEAAAHIVERRLSRLTIIHEGPVRQWLPAISHEVATHHPRICIAQLARCLGRAKYDEAKIWLRALEKALLEIDDIERSQLDPHVNVYRALYALPLLDLEVAARGFRAVVEDSSPQAAIPGSYARGLLGLTLFWLSGPDEALPHLREGAKERRRLAMGDTGITAYLASAYAELGKWDRCQAALDDTFALPRMAWSRYPDMAPAHYANARLLHHRGQQDEAVEAARLGLTQAEAWPMPALRSWGYLVMSDISPSPADKRRLLMEAELHAAAYPRQHHLRRTVAAARQQLDTTWPVRTAQGVAAELLTRREIDVLRLFRSNLSLRDIGSELDITLNTVKGYTKSIYRKLQVSSRADAVAVAAEIGTI